MKEFKIAVIGLGYVGLPLAIEFGKKYKVLGYDINQKRVEELQKGFDHTLEADLEDMNEAINIHKTHPNIGLSFSSDEAELLNYNTYIVTVPTPINNFNMPDLQPLIKASQMLGRVVKKDDIVIYESTTYPGCTEEDCVPQIEKTSGLKFNVDFYAGYSPERINPGDKINTLTKIKKVTSGSTPEVADIVNNLYASIITAGTHKAPSIKVAEASKIIENAQRDVNISFVNELALIFDKVGIDTNDVLDAAGTKWNFLKYRNCELAYPVHPAAFLLVNILGIIKIFNFSRNAYRIITGIKLANNAHAGLTSHQTVPKLLHRIAYGCHCT